MKADYFGVTDIGSVRKRNEDAFVLQEVWGGSHILAAVIDGMGGYAGGDVAAQMAADCLLEHIAACSSTSNNVELLEAAVVYANNTIHSHRSIPMYSKMGCVLTVALIDLKGARMDVCHVGDTRLYMIEGGALTKITRDDSLVGSMEDAGRLTEEEAMKHPMRNVVSKYLGGEVLQAGSGYIQTYSVQLRPCTLLLCSDGLYDLVCSSQMVAAVANSASPRQCAESLVSEALSAGGIDNVTTLIINLS